MDFIFGLCFLAYGLITTEWLVPKIFVRLGYFKSVDEIWAKRDKKSGQFWGAIALGLKGEDMAKISSNYIIYAWKWPLLIIMLAMTQPLLAIIGIAAFSILGS